MTSLRVYRPWSIERMVHLERLEKFSSAAPHFLSILHSIHQVYVTNG